MKPFYESIAQKIQGIEAAKLTLDRWKNQSDKIVFTNGCFDLIHLGHLYYLAEAASLGDRLIVAVNSDISVQQLKGSNRPIKNQENRLNLLASLQVVDLVILFEESTPLQLIETLVPDVLVKGGDWKTEEIVGAEIVLQNNGTVQSLSFIEGHSTTAIIKQVKAIL
jgi:rfaE bifunctional protein nucleotidyltransferase chain/domain